MNIRLRSSSHKVVASMFLISVLDLKYFKQLKEHTGEVPLNQSKDCSERNTLSQHLESSVLECFAGLFTVCVSGGHTTHPHSGLLGHGRAGAGWGRGGGSSWGLAPWGLGRALWARSSPACTPGSLSVTLTPGGRGVLTAIHGS